MNTRFALVSVLLLLAVPTQSRAQADSSRAARARTCLERYGPDYLPCATLSKEIAFTVYKEGATPQDLSQILERQLFTPELIMRNQSQLQITDAQRTLITGEISKLQTAVVQMQWGVADETQKLLEHLQESSIQETQALAQMDRLIALETAVKRAQLTMLIRIRNALTPRQVETLGTLRHRSVR